MKLRVSNIALKFRILISLIGFLSVTSFSFSQIEPFKVEGTRTNYNSSKELLTYKAQNWFDMFHDVTLIKENSKKGLLTGKATFNYKNYIDGTSESKRSLKAKRTDGTISYDIIINITDTTYSFLFTNFIHTSANEKNGISYGIIPKKFSDFQKKCSNDEDWCELVWQSLKTSCEGNIRVKMLRLNW